MSAGDVGVLGVFLMFGMLFIFLCYQHGGRRPPRS